MPPLIGPTLVFNNESKQLLVDGAPVSLRQIDRSADARRIATIMSTAASSTVIWLRKGRSTFPLCNDGCDILAEILHAGLWLRERFWQAVHSRHAGRQVALGKLGSTPTATSTASSHRESRSAGTTEDPQLGLRPTRREMRNGRTFLVWADEGKVPPGTAIHGRALGSRARRTAATTNNNGDANGDAVTNETAHTISVALHVRRGDVTWLDRYGKPSHRWVETYSVLDVLRGLRTIFGVPLQLPHARVHLYSERGWLANDTAALRTLAPDLVVHLDSSPTGTVDAMVAMASADGTRSHAH